MVELLNLILIFTKVEIVQNENFSDIVKMTDDIMARLSPPKIDDLIGAGNKSQIDFSS